MITLAEPTREEWLAERMKGIGASEIAAIVGVDPNKTPLQVYLEKKGLADPEEENWPMWWGSNMEPVLLAAYVRKTGRKAKLNGRRSFVHPKVPFIFSTPDAFEEAGPGVELKAPGFRQHEKWGLDGTDEVPENYVAQVALQMATTDRASWHLAAKLDQELRVYDFTRNEELEEALIEAGVRFWHDHVKKGVPPEPTRMDADALKVLYPKDAGEIRPATVDEAALIAILFQAREAYDIAEADKDEVTAKVKALIGDDAGIIVPGLGKVTWKVIKGKTVTDWQALAMSYKPTPLEIERYTKVMPGPRRFLASPEKEKKP